MIHRVFGGVALGAMVFVASAAQATNLMPDFAGVPTGWTTDRYEPHNFSEVGPFQGRDPVLGIEIHDDEAAANRGGQGSTFYNTQGRKFFLSGGIGDSIGADLFIENSWSDESAGSIRSDMWGTMEDAANTIAAYGIIGFTNLNDTPRFRVFDAEAGGDGWVDLLLTAVAFGQWTAFEMELTATSFVYSINGAVVYTDNTTGGATNFREVIMQAYNFGDPALSGVEASNYTAHWSNSQVPEPAALGLLGLGLVGLVAARRRKA